MTHHEPLSVPVEQFLAMVRFDQRDELAELPIDLNGSRSISFNSPNISQRFHSQSVPNFRLVAKHAFWESKIVLVGLGSLLSFVGTLLTGYPDLIFFSQLSIFRKNINPTGMENW